ncbi:MAG: hypothetical protein HW412_414 [Bacteroidetes bacterium]|nr:hypothetical protein [Bacteroidota bacterium]
MRLSIVVACAIVVGAGDGKGQLEPSGTTAGSPPAQQLVRFYGTLGSYGEAYSIRGQQSRRPGQTGRLYFRPTLSIWQIDLPFEFVLSTEGRSAQQPFNQFGVNPTIAWATLHVGHHHISFSEFTISSLLQFGGGVDLRPGVFRFSATAGRTQQSISADSGQGLYYGTFRRHLYGMKLGIGREDGSLIDLNVVRAKDDVSSLSSPGSAKPQENMVVGLAGTLRMFENMVTFSSELAVSAHTPNMLNEKLDVKLPSIVSKIFTPRIGTRIGYAGKGSLQFTRGPLVFNARYMRINPGFTSFGLPSFQNDREEIDLSPVVRLLENRLTVGTTIGFRRDNLAGNKLATTRRVLQSYFVNTTPTDQLSLDVRYSNFTMKSNSASDTIRFDNVSHSLNLSPTVRVKWIDLQHVIATTIGGQKFKDRNRVYGALNGYTTYSGSITWAVAFPSSLVISPRASYTMNDRTTTDTKIMSLGLAAQYSFFDRSLTPSLSFTTTRNNIGIATDKQLVGTLNTSYRVTAFDIVALSARVSSYVYGNGRASNFVESMINLQYNRSF